MAVSAEFLADFASFSAGAVTAAKSLGEVETAAARVDDSTIKAAEAAGRAFMQLGSTVVNVAKTFLESYSQEEQATAKLVAALQNQGTATDAVVTQMGDLATAFQNTTTYSDDMITNVQAILVQVGNVMPGQMQAALTATTNLAAGLGINLNQAATLVAKSIGSGGESLGKLKVILGETIKPGAEASEILSAINEKFGGQAAAKVDTYAGNLERLNNKLDDFRGKVGEVLANALTPLLTAFSALPDSVQTIILGVGALVVALTPVAIAIGALTPAVLALSAALGITLAGSLAAIGALLLPGAAIIAGIAAVYYAFKHWDAIVDIARSVYEGVKTWLVDRFAQIVAWVQQKIDTIIAAFRAMMMAVTGGSYVPDMVSDIGREFGKLDRLMVTPAEDAAASVAGAMGGGLGSVAPSVVAGGGGPTNVVIYVNGTAEEVARKVAAEFTRTMKSATKVKVAG